MRDAVDLVIEPRPRDLGGFEVRRVLPAAGRRTIGPFVFFDHMGPADFAPGTGIDVRPHPHIGLATVTYLFDGEIEHRDSLGYDQPIRPGDVNWMVAGRGIVHSERTGDALRAAGHRLHGLQTWVALPRTHEETDPSFVHIPSAELPEIEREGARMRVIVGSAFGATAPAPVFSGTLYVEVKAPAGTRLPLPDEHAERALYLVSGGLEIDGRAIEPGTMAVLVDGTDPEIVATEDCHAVLAGGAPMDGPRHLWWNFVSSSKERIEQAKADWRESRFDRVPGDTEFIPLPD